MGVLGRYGRPVETNKSEGIGVRAPVQRRSQETFDRILVAADSEIAEHGLAGTTTTAIAQRAGVSVGALYRFFDDKDALATALADKYLRDIGADFRALLDQFAHGRGAAEVIVDLVDLADAAQLAHPGYYRLTEEIGPEQEESRARQVRTQLVDLFTSAIEDTGRTDPDLRTVVALCIESVRNTLARAPREAGPRAVVVAELKQMLASYLSRRLG